MSEARFHHYHFAHRALPSAFFENPNDSMRLLQSSIGNQWLNRLWQASGEKIISPNEGAILEAIGLSVTTCFVGDRDCVLVRMPAPECALEVYFALLVNEHESRYFVLERTGEATSNEPIGVVCEWLEDGGRRNHQLHIHADEEVFGDTVAELLHREEVPPAGWSTPSCGGD